MGVRRMTVAQAIVRFLARQFVSRDGVEQPFFAGMFGIFGHGNVTGLGQALEETGDLKHYQPRNEQAMVHTAAAYAEDEKSLANVGLYVIHRAWRNQHGHGSRGATINRLPVLLLPATFSLIAFRIRYYSSWSIRTVTMSV